MRIDSLPAVMILMALSCASGLADAKGFLHASRMWRAGGLVWIELARSAAGFALGIGLYWISARFMDRLGIVAPEAQTLIWFAATIIGVATASGRVGTWPAADQVVACGVLVGLCWLMVRQAATP